MNWEIKQPPFLAGSVKCPKCGEGFRDVSPTFEVNGVRPGALRVAHKEAVSGHCQNGHLLIAGYGSADKPNEVCVRVFEK